MAKVEGPAEASAGAEPSSIFLQGGGRALQGPHKLSASACRFGNCCFVPRGPHLTRCALGGRKMNSVRGQRRRRLEPLLIADRRVSISWIEVVDIDAAMGRLVLRAPYFSAFRPVNFARTPRFGPVRKHSPDPLSEAAPLPYPLRQSRLVLRASRCWPDPGSPAQYRNSTAAGVCRTPTTHLLFYLKVQQAHTIYAGAYCTAEAGHSSRERFPRLPTWQVDLVRTNERIINWWCGSDDGRVCTR